MPYASRLVSHVMEGSSKYMKLSFEGVLGMLGFLSRSSFDAVAAAAADDVGGHDDDDDNY